MVASSNKLTVLCWVDFTATYFDPAPPATLHTALVSVSYNRLSQLLSRLGLYCKYRLFLDCLDGHNGEDEDEQVSITTEDPFNDDKDQSELQEEETEIDQLKTEVFISQFD